MPEVVTHCYDATHGMCLNICSLSDIEASQILDRLRRDSRPTLKPNHLARRRVTEEWLWAEATKLLGRSCEEHPTYFFLGDFSYHGDPSRPAALVVPLSSFPTDAITFTLGDSMSVVEQPTRRVYNFDEMAAFFANGEVAARFGFSNASGLQPSFIELQLWDSFNHTAWVSRGFARTGTS